MEFSYLVIVHLLWFFVCPVWIWNLWAFISLYLSFFYSLFFNTLHRWSAESCCCSQGTQIYLISLISTSCSLRNIFPARGRASELWKVSSGREKTLKLKTLMTTLVRHVRSENVLADAPEGWGWGRMNPPRPRLTSPHLKDCFPLHPFGDSAVRFSPLPSTDERLCSISTLITQRNAL